MMESQTVQNGHHKYGLMEKLEFKSSPEIYDEH